jgi:hypothetical protein
MKVCAMRASPRALFSNELKTLSYSWTSPSPLAFVETLLFALVIGGNEVASCGSGATCFLITCVIRSVSELSSTVIQGFVVVSLSESPPFPLHRLASGS